MIRSVKDIFLNKDGLLRIRLGVLAFVFVSSTVAAVFVGWLFHAPLDLVGVMWPVLIAAAVLFNPRVKIRKPRKT